MLNDNICVKQFYMNKLGIIFDFLSLHLKKSETHVTCTDKVSSTLYSWVHFEEKAVSAATAQHTRG